jgi:hypothetical protein
MEEVTIEDSKFCIIIITKSLEAIVIEIRLHCDILSIELFIDR